MYTYSNAVYATSPLGIDQRSVYVYVLDEGPRLPAAASIVQKKNNMGANSKIPFLVLGGGIGGVAAALSLARRGRQVHVLEKATDLAEIGAGLQLAPNAMRVLEWLGVLEQIKSG